MAQKPKTTGRPRKKRRLPSLAEMKRADAKTWTRWRKRFPQLMISLQQTHDKLLSDWEQFQSSKHGQLLEKLEAGLKSSKRQAWQELMTAAGEQEINDVAELIRVMPRPKPPRGRPAGSGGYMKDDELLVQQVIDLTRKGLSRRKAAESVVDKAKGGSVRTSRRKRIERRLQAKLGKKPRADGR